VGDLFAPELIESIEMGRLRLERWDPERHTEPLVELNADPAVMRFIGDGRAATRAESERQSATIAGHWTRYGFGLWAVRAPDGPVFGFAGLSHPLWLPAEQDEVEVGWRLRREAWGQGFASEAGRAGVDLAFGALGLERVVSYIRPENARSQAVGRRLGMAIARSVQHPRLGHELEVWELRGTALRAGRPRRAGA
jgi:RimJ/RimL family protein N-acetyltransferase